jgi:hypothetical protein
MIHLLILHNTHILCFIICCKVDCPQEKLHRDPYSMKYLSSKDLPAALQKTSSGDHQSSAITICGYEAPHRSLEVTSQEIRLSNSCTLKGLSVSKHLVPSSVSALKCGSERKEGLAMHMGLESETQREVAILMGRVVARTSSQASTQNGVQGIEMQQRSQHSAHIYSHPSDCAEPWLGRWNSVSSSYQECTSSHDLAYAQACCHPMPRTFMPPHSRRCHLLGPCKSESSVVAAYGGKYSLDAEVEEHHNSGLQRILTGCALWTEDTACIGQDNAPKRYKIRGDDTAIYSTVLESKVIT